MEIQTKFNVAIKTVLRHEGLFVNRSHDHGGPTNYGISLAFLKENNIDINGDGVIDIEDISAITEPKAIELYKEYFWDKYHYDQIDSFEIATKIFDLAVNMGPHETNEIAQRVVNKLINGSFNQPKLIEDGILGCASIAALNKIAKLDLIATFVGRFNLEAASVYYEIVQTHPEQLENLVGWLNRLKN